MEKKIMIKTGSGAVYESFNHDNKTASLDFSGNFPFYPGDSSCYRNDSTVFLYIAHSYLQTYYEVRKRIKQGFEMNERKTVLHLIVPIHFCFRHYVELELKAFIMALNHDKADNTHKLLKLYNTLLKQTDSCDGLQKTVAEDEFAQCKLHALKLLGDFELLIKQFLQNEPYEEFYRYLYDSDINLPKSEVKFDYYEHEGLFESIISVLAKLEVCYSKMVGFNFLLG